MRKLTVMSLSQAREGGSDDIPLALETGRVGGKTTNEDSVDPEMDRREEALQAGTRDGELGIETVVFCPGEFGIGCVY